MSLNFQQQRFVAEYLVDLNATQAAIRAGYSEKTAGSQGHDLLKKPEIAQAITDAQAERIERTNVTADRVLQELALLGFSNMGDFATPTEDGSVVFDFSAMTRAQSAAISELTVEEFMDGKGDDARDVRRIKFKLADKRGALTALLDHVTGGKTLNVNLKDLADEASQLSREKRDRMRAAMTAAGDE